MQYSKPTLGRNFNITNCSEYIRSVTGDLTRDIISIKDKHDVSINDMNIYKRIVIHMQYLQAFNNQLAGSLAVLKELSDETSAHLADVLDNISCASTKWADQTDFEELKHDIINDQLDRRSSNDISNIQSNPDQTSAKTSSTLECLPSSLDVEGLYELTKSEATWKLPKINSLSKIPPAFYFYDGDSMHERGVYICLSPGIVVHIPDVRVVPEACKHRTAACKDGLECRNYECTFAHPGTPYMKLGIMSRCPGNPTFGDRSSYGSDINSLTENDARMLMLYSLTDLFPIVSWLQKNKDPHVGNMEVIRNLHICEPDRS